jgi:hypothetical protein
MERIDYLLAFKTFPLVTSSVKLLIIVLTLVMSLHRLLRSVDESGRISEPR